MAGAAVIIIIIVVILILLGGGIGLYFLLRKKTPDPTSLRPLNPPPTARVNPPSTLPTPIPTVPVTPPSPPPRIIAISPVKNLRQYLTVRTDDTGPIRLAVTSLTSIPCNKYQWKMLENYNPMINNVPIFNRPIPQALALNVSTFTEYGKIENAPPEFLMLEGIVTQASNVGSFNNANRATWTYNPSNKTFCNGSNDCLYLDSFGQILVVKLDPRDRGFQWEIVTPPVSPNCVASV